MNQHARNAILILVAIVALAALACNATLGSSNKDAPSTDELVQAAVATAVATIEAGQATLPEAATAPVNVGDSAIQGEPVLELELIDLYNRVNPSVVHVISPFGSGSGFVFDEQGHIVTNNHVVEGSDSFEVVFSNGERRAATVVGTDVDADLAVIRVDSLPAISHPVVLGDSSQVLVGQVVVAIGNPFAETGSMSMGIISGLGRSLASQREGYSLPEVIQTDAPINPGNSGGPLLDLQGRVIGVNSAIRSTTGVNSGVGFAIPSNAVRRIAPALIETGHYTYPFLGIQVNSQPIDLLTQQQLNLPQTTGAYVIGVTPGSPAEAAGIIGQRGPGGDLIVAINGQPVQEFNDLLSYLVFETEVGDVVRLELIRNNEHITVDVTLGERP